jgi:hypothetical protein
LKVETAVEPLIELLRELDDDEYDDWAAEELPHVLGKIGPAAIDPLTQLAKDRQAMELVRSTAACGLRRVADYHPETRDVVVARLAEMMASARVGEIDLNSTLLVELVELRAVEAAEPIERAFAGNLVDVGMMGDWEEVRRELGVKGLGLPMPPRPYNSLEEVRTGVGRGIFSARPIYSGGEIDYDAAQAYCQRAVEAFSQSAEAQQVVDRYGGLAWVSMLLDFGIQYLGEIVERMTVGSVEEFVFDYVPRKVSTEPESAAAIIYELAMFWQYLDRAYQLPEAKSIVERLKTDGLAGELEAELSNPENFGMAKSMFMMGNRAGYDMTSEAGLAEYIKDFNQSLDSVDDPDAAPPLARGQRVGRNDPCPCGSGKKFKKCCLRQQGSLPD